MQAALARTGVRLARRPQRLAAQRRRYTEERIAAHMAALGFADVHAYLADRVEQQGWLLAEVAAELAAHRLTVRRLLERHGRRVGRRGWRSWALRIWPRTSRHAMSRRGGRSSGCGPSFGLAAGGWWGR